MNIETLDSADVHIDEDSHLNYSVIELKEVVAKSEDELEHAFERRSADETTRELATKQYQTILNSRHSFLGKGFTAFVYKQHPDSAMSNRCIKCRWDFLIVGNTSKKIKALPANLQPLKEIEAHFKIIAEKRKERLKKGIEELPDNSILRESSIQHLAALLVREAGLGPVVPDIKYILNIEREESGDVSGDRFSAAEDVSLMLMEMVPGRTVQEIIYEASPSVASKLDVDFIERELRQIIDVLHKGGVAHRDLTIRNIMLDDKAFLPRVIDFGKSKFSPTLADDQKQRDLESIDQAIKWLRKFKSDPLATSEELDKKQQQ